MYIPNGAIVPLFIASFIMLAFQYYRNDPVKRVLNPQFGLMSGAIVLMFAAVMLASPQLSLIFFVLALVWLGLAIYLFRLMVPPKR